MKKTTQILATALVLGSLCWALPLAAAPQVGDHGEENNIFAGDVGNVLWTLLVFGLVVFVLGKFAWGPLLETFQKREDFIRESLESAKSDREAAEARLREYEERLHQARAEATSIVEEGRRDGEVLRQRIEEGARVEADKIIARSRREIGIARETAVKELYELGAKLATELAGKIVGRELRIEDHERMIRDSIADMERLEHQP
ncbi:MAG: F0F1 ATP synthase subunit B [Thermoanaerobaculia bacterium]